MEGACQQVVDVRNVRLRNLKTLHGGSEMTEVQWLNDEDFEARNEENLERLQKRGI